MLYDTVLCYAMLCYATARCGIPVYSTLYKCYLILKITKKYIKARIFNHKFNLKIDLKIELEIDYDQT